jgi:hypothetical protein
VVPTKTATPKMAAVGRSSGRNQDACLSCRRRLIQGKKANNLTTCGTVVDHLFQKICELNQFQPTTFPLLFKSKQTSK